MADYSVFTFLSVANTDVAISSGRLTLAGRLFRLSVGVSGCSKAFGVFLCECGEFCVKQVGDVCSGKTKSCGCMRKEVCYKNTKQKKHGMHKSPEFTCWVNMKSRCSNTKHNSYADYGGRGIRVCDRWLGNIGFSNFLSDMGKRPSSLHSIDRIDVNGGYSPDNCRWATLKEQNENKRNNRFVFANGMKMTVAQWSRHLGVPVATLAYRIRSKWSDNDVVNGKSVEVSE